MVKKYIFIDYQCDLKLWFISIFYHYVSFYAKKIICLFDMVECQFNIIFRKLPSVWAEHVAS